MNSAEDKMSQESDTEVTGDTFPDHQRSGRITYDERGNSVWEWQIATGVFSRDISTQRLQRLDLSNLSLVETGKHPIPSGIAGQSAAPIGSPALPSAAPYPYGNSSTAGGNVGSNPYNSDGPATLKSELKAAAPRKPMDLRQQEEWLEIRRRAQRQASEDSDDGDD